jgi:clan AA aspartic protease (TIGR02281 family)
MGETHRLIILIAALAIGGVIGGQAIFSRISWDQAIIKARASLQTSEQVNAGSEESVIPLERWGGVWIAKVEFNDLYESRLIVDTGATFTTISEDLAFDAGVRTDPVNPIIDLLTTGGKIQAKMGVARRIRVGNAGRDDVRVVIHTIPNLPDGIDGLLGLSFFDRFLIRLDHSNQQLHLSPRG